MSLIKTVLLGSTVLVCLLASTLPFWYNFQIKVSYDAGKTILDKSLDLGLFYMIDEGPGINMIDLVFLGKASNNNPVPGMMRVAQIFFIIGDIGMVVCFVASVIYLVRKYRTATGELCLAGAIMPAACCISLGAVFGALWPSVEDAKWVGLPVPGHFMQLDPQPIISVNWGVYVAAVGAILAIVSSVIAWFQACTLCRHVENVRYRMLRAPITEEDEFGPTYKGPSRLPPYKDYGYSKPGMEMDF